MVKIILIIISLFSICFKANATSFTGKFYGGDVIDGVYIVKVNEDGSVIEPKRGQFIIESTTGNYVYCLEPFVKVNNNYTYDLITDNYLDKLNISEDTWKYINLLSYYGYMYQDSTHDHSDPSWYYITQVLIWRATTPNATFYFTDTYNGNRNDNLFIEEIKEIEELINKHNIIPRFNIPEYIEANDIITLKDINNVIDNYRIVNSNASISINNNYITIKGSEDIEFTLERNFNNQAILYYSNNSQKILYGSNIDNISNSYSIKVIPKVGNITIKKMGEEIIYKDNTYSYEEVLLDNILFGLYDKDNNLIEKGLTNEEGILIFGNLVSGTYYIQELSNMDNYVLNPSVYEIDLGLDDDTNSINNAYLEIHNYLKKGSITINKYDYDTLLGIEDTLFNIYDSNNNIVYSGSTDSSGKININNLPYGSYILEEVRPREGYQINTTKISFTIDDINSNRVINVGNKKEEVIEIDIPNTDCSYVTINIIFYDFNKKRFSKII